MELDEQYIPTDVIADKQRYHLMDAERGIMSYFKADVQNDYEPEVGESRWDQEM